MIRLISITCFFIIIILCFYTIGLEDIGIDYSVYFTSAKMVLTGEDSHLYDPDVHHEKNEFYRGEEIEFPLGWYYPPIYLLFILPLGFVNLKLSYLIFMGLTFILYLASFRKFKHWYLSLGFTGVLLTLYWGQNGFLIVFLIMMMFEFDETPPVSGLMLGLMCFKPHFSIVFIIIFILRGRWQHLKYTSVTLLVLLAITSVMFGVDMWVDYFRTQLSAGSILSGSSFSITNAIQPSVFASVKLLGFDGLALIIQGITALSVVLLIGLYKDLDKSALYSGLVLAVFLVNPYFLQYDLVLLAVPMILISQKEDFTSKLMGQVLFWTPLVTWLTTRFIGVQITPFILLFILMYTIRTRRFSANTFY